MSSKKKAATTRGRKTQNKKVAKKKDWKTEHKHLFTKKPRNFGIGQAIQPKRDLSRYVKWPRYIRIQRQRAILKKRLKVPPAINHFTTTLEKNQASTLFRLLAHYQPESPEDKKKRLVAKAQAEAKGEKVAETKAAKVIKFGLNHVTTLVETRKAKLVVIAHDVDPIELVLWLPGLCRRMDVPYVIVKGKARLGQLVHQKTAAVVALTEVKKEHVNTLEQFISNTAPMYNAAPADQRKKWGGGIMGVKAQAVQRLREKEIAREAAKALRV